MFYGVDIVIRSSFCNCDVIIHSFFAIYMHLFTHFFAELLYFYEKQHILRA